MKKTSSGSSALFMREIVKPSVAKGTQIRIVPLGNVIWYRSLFEDMRCRFL